MDGLMSSARMLHTSSRKSDFEVGCTIDRKADEIPLFHRSRMNQVSQIQ